MVMKIEIEVFCVMILCSLVDSYLLVSQLIVTQDCRILITKNTPDLIHLMNILCSFVLKVQCPMSNDCPALKMGYSMQNTALWVVVQRSLVEIYCPEKPAVFFFYSEDRGSRFPQNVVIFLHVATWHDFSEDSILNSTYIYSFHRSLRITRQ